MKSKALPVPFNTTYWVIPGRFLAGDHPYSNDPVWGRKKFERFRDAGINCFIDLTQPGDAPFYSKIAESIYQEKQISFTYHRKGIYDFSCPTEFFMKQVLDLIDQLIDDGKTIYIHCRGGIGRTGTTVGCYLVRHGMDGDAAIRKIKEMRSETVDWFHQSPETDDQRKLVKSWIVGQ